MFKVICVDNLKDDATGDDAPELEVGTEYEVERHYRHPFYDRIVYELVEFPDLIFDADYFSAVNALDTDEIEEEWLEQEAAYLDRELAAIVHQAENA